jgi:CPA1 family monovalent cation:H+ antiporter
MKVFDVVATLIVLAGFSYINHRWLKLPTTVGLMAIAQVLALALIGIGSAFPPVVQQARAVIERIDFNETLLHGMLGFLLFAGALHVDLNDLTRRKLVITVLATAGVLTSTFLVGALAWCVLPWVGLPLRFLGEVLCCSPASLINSSTGRPPSDAIRSRTCPASVTSSTWAETLSAAEPSSETVSRMPSAFRSARTRRCPFPAKCSASARPRPLAAPVSKMCSGPRVMSDPSP